MLKRLLFFSAVVACINSLTLRGHRRAEWTAFKFEHNKQYENEEEELLRYQIFNENSLMIARHNQLYAQGKVSYELDINQFADMSHEEFLEYLGTSISAPYLPNTHARETFEAPSDEFLPTTVDWRLKGAVTPVKAQGYCDSSWAFATTGALESQLFIKNGSLIPLSEQNLIDCSSGFGTDGCRGGTVENAYAYIYFNKGIATEASYEYRGRQYPCKYNNQTAIKYPFNYLVEIKPGDEQSLKVVVGMMGPVAATINASGIRFYKGGAIYDNPACNSTTLNQSVLIVGYGTQNGQDYWLVKNSWNVTWGDRGYIKMSRNKNNQCGIASLASFPKVGPIIAA